MNKEQLQKIVFEALGEASMCWSEIPQGVFESTRALEIGNRIMKAFDEYRSLPSPSLPSDEEIDKIYDETDDFTFVTPQAAGARIGAKWMRSLYSTRIAEMEMEVKRLRFMIDNGLGSKDIQNDI